MSDRLHDERDALHSKVKKTKTHFPSMKTLPTLAAILLTGASAVFAAPQIGSPAPDISATDTNGKRQTLSQYKGKFVVLEWTNPECPFVHKHYDSGNMQKLQKEYTAKGVVWLSINSSAAGKQGNYTPEKWNEIVKQKGAAPTAVLLDPDGKVGHAYDAKTTPHIFIINPDGKLIYEGGIDSIRSPDQADIPKATNYVRATLDEAMAGKPVTTPVSQPYGCGVKY
jgi:peroxiredoxin